MKWVSLVYQSGTLCGMGESGGPIRDTLCEMGESGGPTRDTVWNG